MSDSDPITNLEKIILSSGAGYFSSQENPGAEDYFLLVQKGAIFDLLQDASPEAVHSIWRCAAQTSSLEVQQSCIWVLEQLSPRHPAPILDALFDLSVRHHRTQARQALLDTGLLSNDLHYSAIFALLYQGSESYRRSDPGYKLLSEFFFTLADHDLQEIILSSARLTLPKWHKIASAILQAEPDAMQELVAVFPQFDLPEQTLCFNQLKSLAQNGCRAGETALLDIFIQHDYLPARDYLVEAQYRPENPVQAALFFFLSEQWVQYESIDFDRSFITSAYELAEPPLKRRMLSLSRATGQIEWTEHLSTTSRRLWLGTLTEIDWTSILQLLVQEKRWPDLWRLAQSAPPIWVARILEQLARTDWQPAQAEEQEIFPKFIQHSLACLANFQIIAPLEIWHAPSQETTCLTVNAKSSSIAAGSSTSVIHLWKYSHPIESRQPIIGPVARTYSLIFSPNGEILAIANGDNAIRLFDTASGRLLKTLNGHRGLVRSLFFSPDGRFLYSAGFDGRILSWRIPEGTLFKTLSSESKEIFSLFLPEDGTILISAGADLKLSVFRLSDGERIRSLEGHQDTITCLTGTPNGQMVASHARNKEIFLWNTSSGKSFGSFQSPDLLTGLALEPRGRLLFGGNLKGQISLWNLPNGSPFSLIHAHATPVTGLWMAPLGDSLFSSSSDGMLCWWDLRLLNLVLSPVDELLSSAPEIKELVQKSSRTPAENAWIAFLSSIIDWRRRYDIQIADPNSLLHIGNFDIEL